MLTILICCNLTKMVHGLARLNCIVDLKSCIRFTQRYRLKLTMFSCSSNFPSACIIQRARKNMQHFLMHHASKACVRLNDITRTEQILHSHIIFQQFWNGNEKHSRQFYWCFWREINKQLKWEYGTLFPRFYVFHTIKELF